MKSMEKKVKEELIQLISESAFQLYTEIEVAEKEPSVGLQGDQLDKNGTFICYHTYRNTIELSRLIVDWQIEAKQSGNRWNKAEFTVYKDGRYEVKTWWDVEFQKSLYGTED